MDTHYSYFSVKFDVQKQGTMMCQILRQNKMCTYYEPNFKLAIRQGNTIAPICSQYHANKIFSQIFKYNLLSSPTGSFTIFTVSKFTQIPDRTFLNFLSPKIRRLTNFMELSELDPRILKLSNCEMFGRV